MFKKKKETPNKKSKLQLSKEKMICIKYFLY